MIGDWVHDTREPFNNPVKLTGINAHQINESDPICFLENEEGLGLTRRLSELKPIPLTVDILEKNEFVRCGEDSLYPQYNDCTHRFSDNRGHVVLLEYIGWSHGYYNVHDITTIHDVHELQHIFKIKKIKREIVL